MEQDVQDVQDVQVYLDYNYSIENNTHVVIFKASIQDIGFFYMMHVLEDYEKKFIHCCTPCFPIGICFEKILLELDEIPDFVAENIFYYIKQT